VKNVAKLRTTPPRRRVNASHPGISHSGGRECQEKDNMKKACVKKRLSSEGGGWDHPEGKLFEVSMARLFRSLAEDVKKKGRRPEKGSNIRGGFGWKRTL